MVRWSDFHFGKSSPAGGLQVESLGLGRALRRQWQWCRGETQGSVGPLWVSVSPPVIIGGG